MGRLKIKGQKYNHANTIKRKLKWLFIIRQNRLKNKGTYQEYRGIAYNDKRADSPRR